MRPPSIRGFGIRYAIALTLPVTGIVLVLYTVVQLLSYSIQERLGPPRPRVRALAGSLGQPPIPADPAATPPPPGTTPQTAASTR